MREEPQRIAGRLEGTLRIPDAAPSAIVVIAHPLPTHGGTMRNPLMATLAHARGLAAGLPLAVVGFSFGALATLRWIASGGRPDAYALLGLPLRSETREPRTDVPPVPSGALVVNGEHDEFATADEIRRTYPQARVVAIAGSDHFFTGHRDEAARVAMDHLALALASP